MSEIVTVEPPQDRAVTLEEARQQLRLDGHDEDLLLGAKLYAAQAELEQQTGLKLCEQILELRLECWCDEITVPVRPCVVGEVRYTAANGATVTLVFGLELFLIGYLPGFFAGSSHDQQEGRDVQTPTASGA